MTDREQYDDLLNKLVQISAGQRHPSGKGAMMRRLKRLYNKIKAEEKNAPTEQEQIADNVQDG